MENAIFTGPVETYDAVFFLEVLEHLHVNPLNALYQLNLALKPEGLLLLSTPNVHAVRNRLNLLMGKDAFEHPLSVFGKLGIHSSRGHQRLYSKRELVELLEVHGFEVERVWYCEGPPPLFKRKSFSEELGPSFPYEELKVFWREKRSVRSVVRRLLVKQWARLTIPWQENIFVLARKVGSFDKELFVRKLQESDPRLDSEGLIRTIDRVYVH
jgi:SAM-dependent methyltransferase